MKGTLISIVVGALGGVLLTLGSTVPASHATANRATSNNGGIVTPAQPAVDPELNPVESPAALDSQAPQAK